MRRGKEIVMNSHSNDSVKMALNQTLNDIRPHDGSTACRKLPAESPFKHSSLEP